MGHRATCQSAMTCAGAPLHPMSIPGGDRAGCLATAGDIARLAAAEMEGAPQSVLLPSAVDAMHQPAVAVGGLFGFAADGYGLGHFTEELSDGRRAVWHGGQGYGLNQTGFTGEQKARKVSYEQRKPREPFFD